MGVKLSQLGSKKREAQVEYGDDIVAITYLPGKFTPRVEARLNEAQAENKTSQEVAQVLSEVLVRWDVLDDNGKPLKPTAELMMDMPLSFLTIIAKTLGEDMSPNAKSA